MTVVCCLVATEEVLNTVISSKATLEARKAKQAMSQGDSLAAMNEYMRLAAKHEEKRGPVQDLRSMPPPDVLVLSQAVAHNPLLPLLSRFPQMTQRLHFVSFVLLDLGASFAAHSSKTCPLQTPRTATERIELGPRLSTWWPNSVAFRHAAVFPKIAASPLANQKYFRGCATIAQHSAAGDSSCILLQIGDKGQEKTFAKYKEDGKRGHHMSDFIPKEEMDRFLAKQGDPAAKARVAAQELANRIGSDNKGHQMMQQMGWTEGAGLGANQAGMANPISAGEVKQDNLGIGAANTHEVSEGDDIYEAYKKRMMLGYKHRPNPLGNPRKQYY